MNNPDLNKLAREAARNSDIVHTPEAIEDLAQVILSALTKATEAEHSVSELRLAVIKDDCETDTNVRELARPILGDFKVDGDSYGVPGIEDIVEELIKLIPSRAAPASAEQQLKRIADVLESVIDREKGTLRMVDVERGNVYKTHLGGKLSGDAAQLQKERTGGK